MKFTREDYEDLKYLIKGLAFSTWMRRRITGIR